MIRREKDREGDAWELRRRESERRCGRMGGKEGRKKLESRI